MINKIKLEMDQTQLRNYIRCLQSENARLKTLISYFDAESLKEHYKKNVVINNTEINRVFEVLEVFKEHEILLLVFKGNQLESELHKFNIKYKEML